MPPPKFLRFTPFVMAAVMPAVALILNLVALVVPDWLRFVVNSTAAGTTVNSSREYFTRSRGLLTSCVSESALASHSSPLTACRYVDLGQLVEGDDEFASGQSGVPTNRRLQLALHLLAALALAVNGALYALWMCKKRHDRLFTCAIVCLVASELQMIANSFFTSALAAEMPLKSELYDLRQSLYNTWPESLRKATSTQLGACFSLAAAANAFCIIGASVNIICSRISVEKVESTRYAMS